MNLAALWNLPVLFCCENNLYAMGTALERSESETDLALKAASYEMPAWAVDGMDVLAVEDAARRAAAEVRDGGGTVLPGAAHLPVPRALDVRPRPVPRQGGDRALEGARSDPGAQRRAQAAGLLDDEDVEQLERVDRRARSTDAIAFAEAGTLEPVEELERFVYFEGAAP